MATDKRDKNGRFLAVPEGAAPPITSATARDMVQRRVEKYRRAMVSRIVGEAKSIDPSVSVGADAYALVASKQFSALMDSEQPRINDLARLGQMMTGADVAENARREHGATPAPAPGTISASPDTLIELIRAIEAERDRRQAIDANAKD